MGSGIPIQFVDAGGTINFQLSNLPTGTGDVVGFSSTNKLVNLGAFVSASVPGGTQFDIQYNNGSDEFGGEANFQYNPSTNIVTLASGKLIVGTTISGGNSLGINTSTPSGNLHVKGRSIFQNNGAIITFVNAAGANVGTIATNAQGGVNYNTTSDRRLKTNIKSLSIGLDQLLQIQPKEYLWKNTSEPGEGFIAQELYEIYPTVVSKPKNEKDVWMVDYGKLTPLLVKSIQDQQKIINDLQERIIKLENNR